MELAYMRENTWRDFEVYQREQQNPWTLRNFGPGDTTTLARLDIKLSGDEIYQHAFFPEEA